MKFEIRTLNHGFIIRYTGETNPRGYEYGSEWAYSSLKEVFDFLEREYGNKLLF